MCARKSQATTVVRLELPDADSGQCSRYKSEERSKQLIPSEKCQHHESQFITFHITCFAVHRSHTDD
eukprot:3569318-Pleurochrysis_carterae.AAC.2